MKSLFAAGSLAALLAFCTPAVAQQGPYLSGGAGWSLNDKVDDTYSVNAGFGYDWGMVRGEVAYDGFLDNDFEGHMPSVNAYFQPRVVNSNLYPYVGIGVGYMFMTGDNQGNNDEDIAVIGSAGLRYAIDEHLGIDGGYRYVRSNAEVVGSNGSRDFESHGLLAKITYRY